MTALDGRRLLALIRRLGAVDARARARLCQVMAIGDVEASVVLALAAGEPLTSADLRSQLDLSPGGARALTRTLYDRGLVSREPDPNDRRNVRLRLSEGAEAELAAALYRLIEYLDTVGAALSDADARVITTCLTAIADRSCGSGRSLQPFSSSRSLR